MSELSWMDSRCEVLAPTGGRNDAKYYVHIFSAIENDDLLQLTYSPSTLECRECWS